MKRFLFVSYGLCVTMRKDLGYVDVLEVI